MLNPKIIVFLTSTNFIPNVSYNNKMSRKIKSRFIIFTLILSIYFLYIQPFIYLGNHFNFKQLIFLIVYFVSSSILVIAMLSVRRNKIVAGIGLSLLLILYFPLNKNVYQDMLWKQRIEKQE